MNLERDGAPDVPTMPDECGCCRYFSPVGEGGSGFCKKWFDVWLDAMGSLGESPTSHMTVKWMSENAIEEGDDACKSFEEYG